MWVSLNWKVLIFIPCLLSSSFAAQIIHPLGAINDAEWHNIFWIRHHGVIELYLDGVAATRLDGDFPMHADYRSPIIEAWVGGTQQRGMISCLFVCLYVFCYHHVVVFRKSLFAYKLLSQWDGDLFAYRKILIIAAEFWTITTEHGSFHGCLSTMIVREFCVKLH